MTYKNMIKGVVEREAKEWLDTFIKTNGAFSVGEDVELRKEDDTCYYKAKFTVYTSPSKKYAVGGVISEDGRIYNSVIYDQNNNIVWMSVEESRATLGIEAFEI